MNNSDLYISDTTMTQVSLFPDTYNKGEPEHISLDNALERIATGASDDLIQKLRSIKDKKQASKYKRNNLLSVTFAGTFKAHSKKSLIEASELMCLDFDSVNTPTFFKQYLFDNYPHIHAAWISPSGTGVKAIVRIPKVKDDAEYKQYYNSILGYLDQATADESTKDISRFCFESSDSGLLQRDWEETSTWEKQVEENNSKPLKTSKPKVSGGQNVHSLSALDTAANMINNSRDGEKRHILLKASNLLGGYVAGGSIDELTAIAVLETAIQNKNIESFEDAQKAIRSGIDYGRMTPIISDGNKYTTEPQDNGAGSVKGETKYNPKDFPLEIFPIEVINMIENLEDVLGFQPQATAAGSLFAVSTALGAGATMTVKGNWTASAQLWVAVVGDTGSMKSHPFNHTVKPFYTLEEKYRKDYKNEMEEFRKKDKKGKHPKHKHRFTANTTTEVW